MHRLHALITKDADRRAFEVAALIARFTLAWIFAYHGAQKLFGWFGGGGISGTGDYFASVGISPGELMAVLAGLTEFVGAILLAIGLLTRLASSLLALEMLIVIVKVNWTNGLIAEKAAGGYEINLALGALACSLIALGAGKWSVDRALDRSNS